MNRHAEASIEADERVPIIRITREFDAPVELLFRAHTDPEIYARWIGPDAAQVRIVEWNAVTGGSWRYHDREHVFRGCFHDVRPDRIVQTFTWEGMPDHVALETLHLMRLDDGRTRLVAESLTNSFETRDAWLRGGMKQGVDQGYAKLDTLVADAIAGGDHDAGR